MCENQCCAYLGSKRCINTVTTGANHCELHRAKATKLYLRYKELGEEVKKFNIDKPFKDEKLRYDYLMNYYCVLNDTYQARIKHRQYAFVPECYDEGHLHQFVKLNSQIQACEKLLIEMYESESDSISESESESEEIIKNQVKKVNRQIKSFKEYRRQQDEETNQLINHYIHENTLLLQKRSKLMKLIRKCVDDLYEDLGDIDYFVKHICTYHIAGHLNAYGYFNDFKPETCKDPLCGCFIDYPLTLACSCVVNTSLSTYFNKVPEPMVMKYYGWLLKFKNRILPLLHDLVILYQHYEDVMFLKVHLVWHPELKRLMLEPDTTKEPPKMTKLFAQTRLKDKYYFNQLCHL